MVVKVPDRLEQWDRQHLPKAAAHARTTAERLRARRDHLDQVRHSLDLRPRALDARYGGLRPLAAVRELPQLGFIAIALVLLAGTLTAVARHEPAPAPPAVEDLLGEGPVPDKGSRQLGPVVGTPVSDYAAAADATVAAAASADAGQPRTALVSLASYVTPSQAANLLAGLDVQQVYLRSPAGGSLATRIPVEVRSDLLGDLRTAYAQAVRNRQTAAKAYATYVRTTANDKPFQQEYQRLLTAAEREARAYQSGCACVFAALVEAPVATLLSVRSRLGVRTLEIADSVIPHRDALVTDLYPEVRGTVPRPVLQGDQSP